MAIFLTCQRLPEPATESLKLVYRRVSPHHIYVNIPVDTRADSFTKLNTSIHEAIRRATRSGDVAAICSEIGRSVNFDDVRNDRRPSSRFTKRPVRLKS